MHRNDLCASEDLLINKKGHPTETKAVSLLAALAASGPGTLELANGCFPALEGIKTANSGQPG
jgi:hypothetical protein